MKKYSIGVDLGGTKILSGVVDTTTGEVISSAKKRTKIENSQGCDVLVKRIIKTIEEALAESNLSMDDIEQIGMGVPGQVDRKNGILISAPNLNTSNLNFKQVLGDYFKKTVKISNDVDVATIGEHNFGAAKGYSSAICIFVGTGIGAGIISGNQIWEGATGTAGEIGHMIVSCGGRPCGCGGNGCLEAYASRTAIEKQILAKIKKGQVSNIEISKDDKIRSNSIKKAVKAGDELVIHALEEASEYLGCGIASVVNFYNPEVIILGGGLVEALDYFYDLTVQKTCEKALFVPSKEIKILKTQLGDFAGIIGAAIL